MIRGPRLHSRRLAPRAGVLVAVVLGLGALGAPLAFGDQQIIAGPPPASRDQFSPTNVTIDQGMKVSFQNRDIDTHNVTADAKGADGQPLFATSGTVGPGSSAEVGGTQFLTTGNYKFVCTIHPGMEGFLHVTSAGTPVPRPASGPGSGTGPVTVPGSTAPRPPAAKPKPKAKKRRHCVKRHGRKRCTAVKRRRHKR
jgi:plastocyanin